jgi:hypothetical protein
MVRDPEGTIKYYVQVLLRFRVMLGIGGSCLQVAGIRDSIEHQRMTDSTSHYFGAVRVLLDDATGERLELQQDVAEYGAQEGATGLKP